MFLIHIPIIREGKGAARFTWGTRECPSRWRSPWVKRTSSCGCWWLPWRGSRSHRCPKRPPAPAEHRPQSTASWRRAKETVTGTAYLKRSQPSSPILTPTSSSCICQPSSSSPPGIRFDLLRLKHTKKNATVATCPLIYKDKSGSRCSHLCPGCVAGQRSHTADCPRRSSSPRLHSGSDAEAPETPQSNSHLAEFFFSFRSYLCF